MVRILCPLLCPDTSCGSCTMMTVSYIEGISLVMVSMTASSVITQKS